MGRCGCPRARGRTPVIALSASVQAEDRQAAMDAGMDGFAHKPLDLPALALEISRVTGVAPLSAPSGEATTTAHDGDADHRAQPLSPAGTDALLVDVQQGLARWGDVQPYHQALRRFAQEQAVWLDAAQHQQAPDTIAQAQATAHRLQGAAANLGLVALVQAARRVERGDADTPSTQRGQAWRQLRQVLHDTLAAVQDTMPTELHTPAAATGDAPPSDPGQPTPADTALVQLWTHQAQRLRQAFHRGECLEPLFAQFCTSVRPHATGPVLRTLQALEQASEDFDFEGAVAALDRLQSHLAIRRSEDAVL